jgi:hypothetical protein
VIDLLIDCLVDRVAAAVVARLENDNADRADEWFDSGQAAEYLVCIGTRFGGSRLRGRYPPSRTAEDASCSSGVRLSTSGASPVAVLVI